MTWKWKLAQWLELRWWQRYLSGHNKESYYSWKKEYWQKTLNLIAPAVVCAPGEYIADAGCGPAGIFIALPRQQVVAIDPLLNRYRSSLPFFDPADFENVSFSNIGLESFKTEKLFDKVFCMNAINHVADIERAYDVLCNILHPSGSLIVSIDAHNYGFFKMLFRLLPGDALHPHQYDIDEYRRFLETRGLELILQEKIKREFFFTHYIMVARRVHR